MVVEGSDSSTQTDPEVHDIFYYKNRAHRAEEALLTLRKMQYVGRLQAELRELERETTNSMQLYSYDPEKRQQLQQDFQHASHRTDQLCRKSEEIFVFNIQSLHNGHELNELPLVDDPDVDLNSIQLGPVTPTIGPKNPILAGGDGFGLANQGSSMMNGSSSPFSDLKMYQHPPSPFYTFYRQESIPSNLNHEASALFMPPIGQRPTAVGSHRSNILPTTTDFSNLGILNSRAPDDVFRSIQLRHPRRTAEPTSTGRMFFGPSSHHTSISTGISSAASASIKQPDVIPKDLLHDDTVNECRDSSNAGLHSDLSISGAMGLDNLDLECSISNSLASNANRTKWSEIATGVDSEMDGEWQAVGSRKTKPTQSSNKGQSSWTAASTAGPRAEGSESANFEKVVEGAMEKYQLTRPEVIAALQKVRNDRHGNINNVPLQDMMKEAEKLFGNNKTIPKTASLTARARAVAGHAEPCDNQLCPARLKQLKYRTELCLSYQTSKMCYMKPGSCVYAHGESELRPLPKEELCERYLEGKCSNTRCVYAHGVSELKNRPIVNPAEYIIRKNKKTVTSNNTHKASVEELTLTVADHDPQGEECTICLETMSRKSRKALDCGHDAFHYKCLKRWVATEGDRSCPLCRSNTLLPEEYPRLGSR